MSSMKSFKSKISQKKKTSQIRNNGSTILSIGDYNLKNVFMNVQNRIMFKLAKRNNTISVIPARIQITNSSGARIFIHIITSKDEYFSISPKKYILQNGNSYQITISLIQLPYVQFQDYQSQSFQINWGKISTQEIANKVVPQLPQSKILSCVIQNKHLVNQILSKQAYHGSDRNFHNDSLSRRQNANRLKPDHGFDRNLQQRSGYSHPSKLNLKDQFAKSGLDISQLKKQHPHLLQQQSLLKKNIIIAVAVISFIVGFITS